MKKVSDLIPGHLYKVTDHLGETFYIFVISIDEDILEYKMLTFLTQYGIRTARVDSKSYLGKTCEEVK
jgi:hypothetical protein